MKVLLVTPNFPYSPLDGARLIIYNLLKQWSGKHRITLLSFVETQEEQDGFRQVEALCERVETVPREHPRVSLMTRLLSFSQREPLWVSLYRSAAMRQKIEQIVREDQFDVVHLDTVLMAQYGDSVRHLPVVVAPHDAMCLLLEGKLATEKGITRKIFNYHLWKRMCKYEAEIYPKFEKCHVVSPRDQQALLALSSEIDVVVIPIGVDCDYYQPQDEESAYPSIVFSGVMSYFPNHDAALYLYREIFPLIRRSIPKVKLYLVGREPSIDIQKLETDGHIVVTGYVEDIRPYLARGTVYVCPLRVAGGIKVKVLEAMAMGKAVVASSVSCEGIEVTHGEDIILADSPQEFARWTVRLLQDELLRRKIAQKARELVQRRYGWEATAIAVERMCEAAIEKKRAKRIIVT